VPIKKRSNRPSPSPSDDEEPEKLVIVAGVKKPLPTDSRISSVMGETPSPSDVRKVGSIAASLSDTSSELLTTQDYVTAMRTPYDPSNAQEVRYRNRVRNRGTAITALCITCQGGRKAVTECIATECALWAFRFGTDPFYGRRK